MKKTAVIILLVIYSSTTIGATVHLHYCMDKFAGWSFWHSKNSKCGKCGMDKETKNNGCCKDEHKIIKTEKEHQQAQTIHEYNPIFSPAIVTVFPTYIFAIASTTETHPQINAPPPKHGVKLYILNCIYRI